jgi:hypothetical protein
LNLPGRRYPFSLIRESAFFFITDNGCYYTIEFAPAATKLGNQKILNNNGEVFEVSIARSTEKSGYDSFVFDTLLHIIVANLSAKGDTCIYFFVCDTTDGKGKAMAKLFDKWFLALQKILPTLKKHNFVIRGFEDEQYDISLCIFENHPYFEEYVSAFENSLRENFSKQNYS